MSDLLYLVAVDGSDSAKRAATRAINLAEKCHAKVKIITVMDWSYLQPLLMRDDINIGPVLNKKEEESNTIKRVITPILDEHKESNINISSELLEGDPTEMILEQAKELQANMVFVGRQGRSRIIDILLGSVANKLAHRIGVPIVLVP